MNNSKLKGITIVLVAAILVAVILFVFVFNKTDNKVEETYTPLRYKDSFTTLDKEFWYAGQWLTNEPVYDELELTDDTIVLSVNEEDKAPYLLSKPIALEDYDLIKIKRRAWLHAASDYFAGGFAVFQTDYSEKEPESGVETPYGEAVILVEYAYDYGVETDRPGEENIRLLGPDWHEEDNYALLPPLFDQWFVEELIIDNANNMAYYTVNGREVEVYTNAITKPYIRIFMHGYGAFTGHKLAVDDIEIKLLNTEAESVLLSDSEN